MNPGLNILTSPLKKFLQQFRLGAYSCISSLGTYFNAISVKLSLRRGRMYYINVHLFAILTLAYDLYTLGEIPLRNLVSWSLF